MVSVAGPQVGKWAQEVQLVVGQAAVCSSDTVREFLENAGQRELLGQYQQVEAELVTGTRRMEEEVKRVLDQLNTYNALTSLYPVNSRTGHRLGMYSQWGNRLMDISSVEFCDQIIAEFFHSAKQRESPEGAARQEHEHAAGAVEL